MADNTPNLAVLELRIQRLEDSTRDLTATLKVDLASLRRELHAADRAQTALPTRLDSLMERLRAVEAAHLRHSEEMDKEVTNLKRFTWMLTGGGAVVWAVAQLLARIWHAPQ